MRFFTSFLIISQFIACSTSKKVVPNIPVITFDENMQDIVTLERGESHTLFFDFTNTGSQDLVIDLVTACKCTELDWPRTPVAPGEKGQIKVVFDSTSMEIGEIIKTVDIIANTDPLVVEAKFKANIVAP